MPGLTEADSILPLKLIVGIGNPGADYANTRHNAGVWFVERLAEKFGASLKVEKKILWPNFFNQRRWYRGSVTRA